MFAWGSYAGVRDSDRGSSLKFAQRAERRGGEFGERRRRRSRTARVFGGAPVTYREIEGETGFNRWTLKRWMSLLRRNAYIATEASPGGVIVRILKAKKHLQAGRLRIPSDTQRARKVAETLRRVGGGRSANLCSESNESHGHERFAERIGLYF
jgi:hypothetical protein